MKSGSSGFFYLRFPQVEEDGQVTSERSVLATWGPSINTFCDQIVYLLLLLLLLLLLFTLHYYYLHYKD